MRKILILLFLVLGVGFLASAQQLVSGSLKNLRSQRQVSFSVDYSKARIDGMTESMFRVQRTLEEEHADGWEDRWEGKTLPKLRNSFCEGENDGTRLKLGTFKETKYTATYVVEELRTNGTNWGKVVFKEAATGTTVAVIAVKGVCTEKSGSWEYRMFEGMRNAGKQLGIFLRKKM